MTRLGSARFEGDTWDLASSVGVTATMVAAARAVASRSPDSLINDRFAEPLVRGVGVDFFSRMAGGELDAGDLTEDTANGLQRFADAMAIRTDRTDVAAYLAGRGWDTDSANAADLVAGHGLPPIDGDDAPFGEVMYLSAERTGQR